LSIDLDRHSAPLLGLSFKLRLERREFGERRIWIRRFLPLTALEPSRTRLWPFAFALTLRTLATVLATLLAIVLAMFATMPAMTRRSSRFWWR
jgi:hypothetical protein